MCGLTTTLDVGTSVKKFPRLCHHASLTPTENGPTTTTNTGGNHPTDEGGTKDDRREAHTNARRNPQSPDKRRNIHNEVGCESWDVIDIVSVKQCTRMPRGMHTVEFIPSSLQEGWTVAWNVVSDLRTNTQNEEESGRALKWLL